MVQFDISKVFKAIVVESSLNPWPWLYQSNTFKKELEIAAGNNKQLPVIIMQTALTLGNGKNWIKSDFFEPDPDLGLAR